jgi:hypothetical protein
MNCKYTCKNYYTFVLKQEDILEAKNSNKKKNMRLNSNNEPNWQTENFNFLIAYKMKNTFHFYVHQASL